MKPGDVVRIVAGGCDPGTGVIVEVQDNHGHLTYLVLTEDDKRLFYDDFELRPVQPD